MKQFLVNIVQNWTLIDIVFYVLLLAISHWLDFHNKHYYFLFFYFLGGGRARGVGGGVVKDTLRRIEKGLHTRPKKRKEKLKFTYLIVYLNSLPSMSEVSIV